MSRAFGDILNGILDTAEEAALEDHKVMEEANRYLLSDAGLAQLLIEILHSDGRLELAKVLGYLVRDYVSNRSDPTSKEVARKKVFDFLKEWAEKIARL